MIPVFSTVLERNLSTKTGLYVKRRGNKRAVFCENAACLGTLRFLQLENLHNVEIQTFLGFRV